MQSVVVFLSLGVYHPYPYARLIPWSSDFLGVDLNITWFRLANLSFEDVHHFDLMLENP